MKESLYKNILNNLHDGVYYVNKHRQITYWNKAANRISGFSEHEVLGHCCSDNILRHIDERGSELCIHGCPLAATMADGKIREADVYLHHKSGHRLPVSVRVSPIYDEKSEIIGGVEIFSDNSSRKHIIEEIQELKKEVFLDPLTHIGNRKYANFVIDKSIMELREFQVPFGFMFLDIDNFKLVNDERGHRIGDDVLKMVADSAGNALRPLDSICRWGGEEFIVIIPNIDRSVLAEAAERIRVLVEHSWIDYNKERVAVTLSIGATMATLDDDRSSLITRADELMYASKTSGKNRISFG